MDRNAGKVLDSLKIAEGKQSAHLGRGYRPSELDKGNIFPVSKIVSEKKVCFIDGGSASIFESPSACLGFIRTAAVIVQANRCRKTIRKEFYVLATAACDDLDSIIYNIKPLDNSDLEGFSMDPDNSSYATGANRFALAKMIDIARRLSEISLARESLQELEGGDLIVLDGNLRSLCKQEHDSLEALYSGCINRGVLLCALSKTCTALTDKGKSLVHVVGKLADPREIWYYHPIAASTTDQHKAEMFLARLNRRSKHIFWFEIQKDQATGADYSKIFGFLAYMSRDLAFPGYPYWLIKTDMIARVSDQEKGMLLTGFLARNSAEKELEPLISTINAHSILDTIH